MLNRTEEEFNDDMIVKVSKDIDGYEIAFVHRETGSADSIVMDYSEFEMLKSIITKWDEDDTATTL